MNLSGSDREKHQGAVNRILSILMGAAVAFLGFLGFFRNFNVKPDRGGFVGNFLLPAIGMIVDAGVLIGAFPDRRRKPRRRMHLRERSEFLL